jgi:methionine synthase I (cobalamin-dependent)
MPSRATLAEAAALVRHHLAELAQVAEEFRRGFEPNAIVCSPMNDTCLDEASGIASHLSAEIARAGLVKRLGDCCGNNARGSRVHCTILHLLRKPKAAA